MLSLRLNWRLSTSRHLLQWPEHCPSAGYSTAPAPGAGLAFRVFLLLGGDLHDNSVLFCHPIVCRFPSAPSGSVRRPWPAAPHAPSLLPVGWVRKSQKVHVGAPPFSRLLVEEEGPPVLSVTQRLVCEPPVRKQAIDPILGQ
ncbi:hypothetical protein CYMTET_6293 [Cymbomonas tetramitiformis]|uniref:Uncharacterized protein n=1 Tax=Cymbomonas tetramitiformis TaxID=36881 RepID=A0AAE0LIM0_9CHLO|nr:hypothetical protein CYMTET_6293 [Cymbomonas tetramitiformis]